LVYWEGYSDIKDQWVKGGDIDPEMVKVCTWRSRVKVWKRPSVLGRAIHHHQVVKERRKLAGVKYGA